MKGEKAYEYRLAVTGVTEHGVALQAILSGQAAIPPQGARIDVAFEGRVEGRIAGRIRGVDYARIRADGRIDLDIRATIETDDGHRIALAADGVATLRPGGAAADLVENVRLDTAAQPYAWVNARQFWAHGAVDFVAGTIHIEGFMP